MMKPNFNQTPKPFTYQPPQNNSKQTIKWAIAFILLLSGIISILLFNSVASGLLLVFAGLLLPPPISVVLERSLKIKRVARYIIIVILVQASLVISYGSMVSEDKPTRIANKKIDSNTLIANTDSLKTDSDKLEEKPDSLKTEEELEKQDLQKIAGNKKRIEDFREKFLSEWDGSFAPLVSYVKKDMDDPDSFEHVETNSWVAGDHVIVSMKFRGKNAYGTKVTNVIRAKASFNGEFLGIISSDE